MLTVHQMLLKNRFLTGIGSGYDKITDQNEPKPNCTLSFDSDCLSVYYSNGNHQQKTLNITGAEILNFSSTKPGVGLVNCAWGFDSFRPDYEIETAKNDTYIKIFS